MTRTVYLVGGAIRDELLGLPTGERDWVVTGARPEDLQGEGYRQVGSSFPVYIHPESGEEYALARTERKAGHGYHGFSVEFDPGVTIEQDLERRDLTINAIARAEDGTLVDPFGGQADLEKRLLRHVSPAFAEDPLRVLRVARFAARFAPLGFTVHPETLELMRAIRDAGELEHLVPERAWKELYGALAAPRPSAFLATLRACHALEVLLPEVAALYGVPQPVEGHPEVDTGAHLELALDMAAALKAGPDVAFAVLLHDLGKGLTDPADWPAHHGHESAGLPLVDRVCARFRAPTAAQRLARQVCLGHLRCHRVLEMRPGKVMALLEDIDALRSKDIRGFVLACEADFRGREGRRDQDYPQGRYLAAALDAALAVRAAELEFPEGMPGPEIGQRLRAARVKAIAEIPVEPDQ
jgi:tRNA nucleotidyltransferase (CCA-adding enzyme)